ncbi:MAG: SdrD B-like domain-containing protein, partial [Methanothrix sp.]
AGGAYSFTGITPGSYTVEEVVKDGWTQSYPASPGTQTVTLVSGVAGPTDINFGNLRTTDFAGMKFEDLNGNGAKDNGEPGLEGWTIKLKNDGIQVASTSTVAGGAYSFTGITPGSYTVEEVSKQGWTQTYPAGNVYTVVVYNNGQVTVTKADQTFVASTEVNFGNMPTASISGMTFEDLNSNGQKDADEKGLKDWTIRLQSPQITETTTTTGQDGSYQFQNLPHGDYTISESLQSGWLQTSPADGSYLVKLKDADVSEKDFGNRKLVEAFQVQITTDPQIVQPGQKIRFTITINSQGEILPDSMGAKNTLPKGLKFVSSNPSPQSVTENADGTSTLIWTGLAFGSMITAQTAESQATSVNLVPAPSPSTTLIVTAQAQSGAPESLTSTFVVTGSTSQAAVVPAIAQACVKCLKLQSVPVKLNKTSDLKVVWPGATVAYNITYESLVAIPLTNVTITEHASSDLIFLFATPAPDAGTENVWSIGDLLPRGKGTISVLFQVKNASNLSFESQSSVSGSGFVNSYRRLSTETQTGGLKNSVTLSCQEFTPVSTSYFVKLRDSEGTRLLKQEHGSGEYRSEEKATLQMENRSIGSKSTLQASYRPTSFSLPGDRGLDYDSEISSLTWTRNRATEASTSQEFRYAKGLEMEQQLLLDKNETIMSIEAAVQGQAHLGVRKKDGRAVKPSPIFESSQDYAGTYRFNQSLQDYGSNVRLARSASGLGWAANDQRLKKSQRSYEHGSGSYRSEELVSTAESYLAKDLDVSYDPQYGYGKWKAGIWSKSPGQIFLGQEITGAAFIQEETKASGLNDMSTNFRFQGKARLRAVSENSPSEVDLDEEYVGQYSLQRKVHMGGVSRFDRPHLTLNKTGRLVPGTAAADYTITVLNDGNAALGPVYVWDIFPAGTDYLGASLKPDRLQPGYANWSLLYLGIGQFVNINLRLNVTDPREELVNAVYASGGHNDEWVTAGNMSVMQFGWLGCCQPEMLVEKQARIDAADSRLIWYRILLKNQANVSLVAQVTDRLPTGLQLLNASAEPQVEGLDLAWVTTAIPVGESRFIEYRAHATQNGKFVNTARVEAHALDGSGGASTEASATVTVGEATSYAEDGWRPPEWGLDRSEIICDDEIAGEGASCTTGSCPDTV